MNTFTKQLTGKLTVLMLSAIIGSNLITACGTSENKIVNENAAATPNKAIPVNNEAGSGKAAEVKATPAETEKSDLIAVYDGRDGISNAAQKQGTAAENSMLNADFKSIEAKVMQSFKLECDDTASKGIEIVGTADGAFTKPDSKQKAFLYERCRAGRAFGIGGIMIVEDGKIAAHYVYGENGLSNGILALPDINKNGLSELVLVSAGLNQGYGTTAIDIIEATGDKTVFIGRTQPHTDNGGAAENASAVESTDYVISVQPSANPTFFRDTYKQKGEDGKDELDKKAEKFSLETKEPLTFVKIS